MSQNFKVLFFLKKGKGSNEKSLPVYVRATIDRERAEWSSQRHCNQSRWNQQIKRASGNKEEAKILNRYLDAIRKGLSAF